MEGFSYVFKVLKDILLCHFSVDIEPLFAGIKIFRNPNLNFRTCFIIMNSTLKELLIS